MSFTEEETSQESKSFLISQKDYTFSIYIPRMKSEKENTKAINNNHG